MLSERRWSGATEAMTASRARENVPLAADDKVESAEGTDEVWAVSRRPSLRGGMWSGGAGLQCSLARRRDGVYTAASSLAMAVTMATR
jgi:hypothetical protein